MFLGAGRRRFKAAPIEFAVHDAEDAGLSTVYVKLKEADPVTLGERREGTVLAAWAPEGFIDPDGNPGFGSPAADGFYRGNVWLASTSR